MTGIASPPLKWHGGKSFLAKKFIALFPPHLHYVEPFFGSGAVLLEKDPEGVSEVVNDIDKRLIGFWNVLADPDLFSSFLRRVQATPFSEEAWEYAGNWLEEGWSDRLSNAHHFFVRCRQSLAGRMKSFAPLSKTRVRRGMNEQASAWLSAVDGLPAVHERLKRVVILCRDALDVLRTEDGPKTLFMCDPPYLHETRASRNVYEHEMSRADHARLLEILKSRRGNWMLCGYRNAMYDDVLAGFKRHDFSLPNNASGGKEKRRMTECLWTSF